VILFTAKSEISPLIKALAVKFGSKMLFAQVKKGVSDVEEKYNVQSHPTIVSVSGENVATFEGAFGHDSLNSWLSGLVGDEAGSSSSSSSSDEEEAPKPKPRAKPKVVDTSFTEATSETFEEVCATSMCIVGFVDSTKEGDRAVVPEHNTLLTKVLDKWRNDGKYKFVWVDRASVPDLVQKFSLPTNGPSFIVYNGKRSKYAKAESFSEVAVHVLLEHVNAGDVKYQQL